MATTLPIRRFDDAASLGDALAADIADRMASALAQGRRFVLGCPGGRSPRSTYAALAREVAARRLDLRRVTVAMMDDYVVEHDGGWQHIDASEAISCRRFAKDDLQAVLNADVDAAHRLPDDNVWFPSPAAPDEYDERLRRAGGIDFFILASGTDGHIAFNPPGAARESVSRISSLPGHTRRDNEAKFPEAARLGTLPTRGVTIGVGTIAELSRAGAMILIGDHKREAFQRITAVDDYDESWPSSAVNCLDDAAIWADAAACAG